MMKKIILDIRSNIHAHAMRPYSSYLFICLSKMHCSPTKIIVFRRLST